MEMVFLVQLCAAFNLLSIFSAGPSNKDENWATHRLSTGESVELKRIERGRYHWFETREGFSVVRTPDRYEYATATPDGGIAPCGMLAVPGEPPLKIPVGVRPTTEFLRKQRAAGASGFSPPSPTPVSVRQPGGTELKLTLKGGPGVSWYEDAHGYAVVTVSGRYEYAVRSPSGELIGCGVEVESMDVSEVGLKVGIRPSEALLNKMTQ